MILLLGCIATLSSQEFFRLASLEETSQVQSEELKVKYMVNVHIMVNVQVMFNVQNKCQP